ncbi:hypothetical protein BJY04DRAFT_232346 [Aspergillus karnatakaensis]|uniref:uncharacterized protein n=1 Tax=Aspergillus karnatakaensis TaxID=1810916 RepID=UPI003CCE20A5
MAADSHQARTHACITCKTRKKKCNRAFPTCSYCIAKDLDCRYIPVPRRRVYATPPTDSSSFTVHHETSTFEPIEDHALALRRPRVYRPLVGSLDGVYLEVQNIIRSTGEFVDDLTARYFRSFHCHLPIVSRTRFQSASLASGGGHPSADTSILLLTICLIAYLPNPDQLSQVSQTPTGSRWTLYLAAKALLAQAQGSLMPTVHLIQATLLLAVYEYASARPEVASITIAGCVKSAYAARIHDSRRQMNGASRLEVEEAANTWWAIVIYERAFACDQESGFKQSIVTPFPLGDALLPIDRETLDRGDYLHPDSIPNIPLACMGTDKAGSFARAAQAACLLDQVLKGLAIPDLSIRLPLLDSLDRTMQSFLTLVLSQTGPGIDWPYCTTMGIAVRALFMLHNHVLNIPPQPTPVSANLRSLEDWKEGARAALDTATTMLVDMVRLHMTILPADGTHNVSPIHLYEVRATLDYVQSRSSPGESPWGEGVATELEAYLERIEYQWVVDRE